MRKLLFITGTLCLLPFAALSQEAGSGLVDRVTKLEAIRLARIEALLELSVRPWEEAGTLREVFESIEEDPNILRRYSFMMKRNGDMRKLTFSQWNQGWRAITDPYLRGDFLNTGQNFVLGGSFWVRGTKAPEDDECDKTPDKVHHYYYEYGPNGVLPRSGNACRYIEATVYRRARVFSGDLPE